MPKASLIVPCKGLDPNFRANIQAFFDQNYPDFEIVFAVASEDDPSFYELQRLMTSNPQAHALTVTAGQAVCRSQKVNNQLHALQKISSDREVLVFLDSDARPEPNFLKHLVQPLQNPAVGLATGFRWYMPVQGGIWSLLRSAWNGGGVVFLTDPRANYAWGGAMAIRKETFEACNVALHWEKALSDDMTISKAVRDNGLQIKFVPQCLVATHEDCTFPQMLEWTNRQTIITRVYHRQLWRKIALAHGLGNAVLCLGVVLLLGFSTGWSNDPLLLASGLLMLAIVPMEMLGGHLLLPAVQKMLPTHSQKLQKLAWKYCLLAPPASMLALVNTVYSLFTNRITWRGITYEMQSPTSTVIISEKP
ncbi:MAG: glycosyltransferase [Desulfohalobiaceae bacterium]